MSSCFCNLSDREALKYKGAAKNEGSGCCRGHRPAQAKRAEMLVL